MNTTVKKVVVKKRATPKTNGNFEVFGKKYSTIEYLIEAIMNQSDDDWYIDEGNTLEIKINNIKIRFVSNRTEFCCGLIEIGRLSFLNQNHANVRTFTPEFTKNFCKFIDLLPNIVEGKTLMINTNGVEESLMYEKALSQSENWTAVKSFKNSNSGNKVTIWLSNNE